MGIDPISTETTRKIRQGLLRWYREKKRDLPWRRRSDPYAIWVSEIMLQQTRVETAVPYYLSFMKIFPTVGALACAKEDRVMKAWEGLGYYSRARNLQKAARIVMRDRKGRFPETARDWSLLPGVGRYTAAAVASIACGEAVPAVDGNARRVYSRLFAIRGLLGRRETEATFDQIGANLVSLRAPGAFNQAVMELGARICLPGNTRCERCPVRSSCLARSRGIQEELPRRSARKPASRQVVVAAAIRRRGRLLIGKRPPDGLLGGLWEFPGGKVEGGEGLGEALVREVREELGISIRVGDELASVDHDYTHLSV
ncbi:MAG: A/G-specific adenine glycosylase, partial [Planctomycetota bacterium]